MIAWIFPAIFAFFFFALGTTIERFFMGNKIIRPELSVFFVGIIGIFYIILIPFVEFHFIKPSLLLSIFLMALMQTGGLFLFYYSLVKFDATSFVPALSAFMPIFSFGAGIFLSDSTISLIGVISFTFLMAGSFIVSYNKKINLTIELLLLAVFTAILLSMFFVSSKFVLEKTGFWTGYIWINIFQFLISIALLSSKKIRAQFFEIIYKIKIAKHSKEYGKIKYALIYGGAKVSGGIGSILQLFAISLAPVAFIGVIQAMQGLENLFIILLSFLFYKISKKFPTDIWKKEALLQKIIGASFIAIGLAAIHLF